MDNIHHFISVCRVNKNYHIFIIILKITYLYLIFDVQVTVHRDKFVKIKTTKYTNFSNLFLEYNPTGVPS